MIRSPRLLLRDIGDADIATLVGHWAEPESLVHVLAYQRTMKHDAWLRAMTALARATPWPRRDLLLLAVERAADGVVLGQVSLTGIAAGGSAVLGWHYGAAHAGAGYATEAAQAMLQHAFVDRGVLAVTGDCFAENGAARRVFAKLGMAEEASSRLGRWWLRRSYGEARTIVRHALACERWTAPGYAAADPSGEPPCAA